jgi:hypothetical protein
VNPTFLDSNRTEARTMEDPTRVLQETLGLAVGLDARELTFFSGVGVFITTADGQQPLRQLPQPSARGVRALHEVCLSIAGRNDLRWLHFCRYPVSFPNLGRFSCEYVERRATANLRLRRAPDAQDTVDLHPTPKAPVLPERLARPARSVWSVASAVELRELSTVDDEEFHRSRPRDPAVGIDLRTAGSRRA